MPPVPDSTVASVQARRPSASSIAPAQDVSPRAQTNSPSAARTAASASSASAVADLAASVRAEIRMSTASCRA